MNDVEASEIKIQTEKEIAVVIPQLPSDVPETEEEVEARKASAEYKMVRKNALSIGQTLEHHGKILDELFRNMEALRNAITMVKEDQILQKNMIVKSLTQKYGTGPTA